jgi:hypothetical protein
MLDDSWIESKKKQEFFSSTKISRLDLLFTQFSIQMDARDFIPGDRTAGASP